MEKVLVLQYACTTSGDEAEAKLARQLPRAIGRKLHATEVLHANFLALRYAVEDVLQFVNVTDMPAKEELRDIAADNSVRFVLFGKVGAKERITIDGQLYDAEQDAVVFRKFFETYAGYTIDALDEIAYRVATHVYTKELSPEQRVELFKRDTTSWEAYLYYLMAEDDRYGLSVGVIPPEPLLAVSAYTEALRIDPTMTAAERGLVVFLTEAVREDILVGEKAIEVLRAVADEFPTMEIAAQAVVYFLVAADRLHEAEAKAREYLQKNEDSPVLIKLLSTVLAEQGNSANAEQLLRAAAEKYDSALYYDILVEFYNDHIEGGIILQAEEHARVAQRKADDARAREALAALPVLKDDHCSLN